MTSRILIVDDEPCLLQIIETALKKDGFGVTACLGGELALERAAECPPHLIIMDLVMPGLDGIETLRYMRQLPALREVPTILLAGAGHPRAQFGAEAFGAQSVVTKPFNPSQLLDEVRRLLTARLAAA
jgi:two-component system alkaline phosphatase synthesis response regulator PhoP